MSTRIEHDLLGEREVPADAYWGIHTLRAIENYEITNRRSSDYPELIRAVAYIKKAEALANRDANAIQADIANAIVAGADRVLTGQFDDQFPLDVVQGGAGTSFNMNANEVIANLALEALGYEKGRYDAIHPNDDVNRSQSTNDVYPTSLKLAMYEMTGPLAFEVRELAKSFETLAQRYMSDLKMGRTQLQDAVPMTSGQEFAAAAAQLDAEADHLLERREDLLTVNLGATAIGTGVNTPDGHPATAAERLAEVTGLNIKSAPELIAATTSMGEFVSFHAALKRLAQVLSKIANDLRLLASGPRTGLAEIRLPEMAAGSSIMPAKVNPVIPEVVNQVCFAVFGNDVTVTFAAEAGQLQLNVMEPMIGYATFESLRTLTNAIFTLRTRCVDGIEVNTERNHEALMSSVGIVTLLNDDIGHGAADEVGKECVRTGRSVREVVLERGLLTEERLDELFSVENMRSPRYTGPVYEN